MNKTKDYDDDKSLLYFYDLDIFKKLNKLYNKVYITTKDDKIYFYALDEENITMTILKVDELRESLKVNYFFYVNEVLEDIKNLEYPCLVFFKDKAFIRDKKGDIEVNVFEEGINHIYAINNLLGDKEYIKINMDDKIKYLRNMKFEEGVSIEANKDKLIFSNELANIDITINKSISFKQYTDKEVKVCISGEYLNYALSFMRNKIKNTFNMFIKTDFPILFNWNDGEDSYIIIVAPRINN